MDFLVLANYEAGANLGTFLICILWLLCLISALRTAKKPGASQPCVYSEVLCAAALLVSSIATAIIPKTSETCVLIGRIISLGCLTAVAAALVMAIIGLATFKPPMTCGRRNAIGTIVFAALVAGACYIVSQFPNGDPAERRGLSLPVISRADAPRVDEVAVFDKFNFRYRAPGDGYAPWDARSINPDVTLAYMRARPQTALMIIAESMGDTSITSEDLAQISRAQIKSLAPGAVISPPKPHAINGMAGMRYTADLSMSGYKLTYVHWDYTHNGFAYQIIVYGPQDDKTHVQEQAQMLASRFEIIDPARICGSATVSTVLGRASSDAFGVAVDLRGKNWVPWPTMAKDAPHAVVGGQTPDQTYFMVVPMLYGKNRPADQAVARALLDLLDVKAAPEQLTDYKAFSQKEVHGFTASHSRTAGETTFNHRTRIIFARNCAYMVTVWAEAPKSADQTAKSPEATRSLDQAAKEVFGNLEVRDTELPPPGKPLTSEQKKSQTALLNSATSAP